MLLRAMHAGLNFVLLFDYTYIQGVVYLLLLKCIRLGFLIILVTK